MRAIKFYFCTLCLVGFISQMCYAQIDYNTFPSVSSTYYINDVYVYNNGFTDNLVDIIIENGFIQSIGANSKKPANAISIEADSMYVYPAFIDVLSHNGIKEEKPQKTDVKFPGLPPDHVAGITPEINTHDIIRSQSSDFSKLRENGYAISQIVGSSGMLPGQTAITLLSKAKDARQFTRKSNQFGQFDSASGVYPATIIGVMAKFRDLYRNAEILNSRNDAYKKTSEGTVLPTSTAAITALSPLTKKEQSLFFSIDKKLEFYRIMALQKELGFNLVITGVGDLNGVLEDVASAGYPLALDLKLPKEPTEETIDSTDAFFIEKSEFKAKRDAAYKQRLEAPAMLSSKNIAFTFSLGKESGGDTKKNLTKLIENGLSEQVAIDAMTTHAAEVLGISKVAGSVTKGKLSNLMITDKPYFDEKSTIRFMVVGKEVHEYEASAKEEKPADESLDILGEWSYEVDTPQGAQKGTILITDAGSVYTVAMSSADDPDDPEIIDNVALSGNELTYDFDMNEGGFAATINVIVKFADSENMTGSVSIGEFGTFPMEGSKISGPE